MKFTHLLNIHEGWIKTSQTPTDFKKVKHLGACSYDGDMFAAYDNKDAIIEIFKGTIEEETLKTDTWYKHKHNPYLVYRTGNQGNYGIAENKEMGYFHCFDPKNWQEATEEEVKEALVKLAKKKGFKNVHKLNFIDPYGDVYEKGWFDFGRNEFKFYNGELTLDGVTIFKNGKWAEILEDEPLTIEERLKRLEDKLS